MTIKTSLISFIKKSVEFAIEANERVYFNKVIVFVFTVLSHLMPLAYQIITKENSNDKDQNLIVIAYLCRPWLLLPNTSDIAIICIFVGIQILIGMQFAATMFEFKFWFLLTAYVGQLYDIWLFNGLLEILLLNLSALSIICIIELIAVLFYRLYITKLSLNFKQNSFNLSYVSILVYLQSMMNIAQIILYIYSGNTLYQALLGLFINLLVLQISLRHCPYLSQTLPLILMLNGSSMLYSIILLIQITSDVQQSYLLTLILLISLFIFRITTTLFHQMTLKFIKTYKSEWLIYFISYIQNNQNHSKFRLLVESFIHEKVFVNNDPSRCYTLSQDQINQFVVDIFKKQQFKNLGHLSQIALLQTYNQNYDSFKKISIYNQKSHGLINKIRLKILYQQNKETLKLIMLSKNNSLESRDLELNVQKFMYNEHQNLTLNVQIQDLCKGKINLYQQLGKISNNATYHIAYGLSLQLDRLLQKIRSMYLSFPSIKLQSMLAFYYSEILNDYLSANKLYSIAGIQEDLQARIPNQKIDLFSNKIAYLVIDFEDHRLVKISNQSEEFFQQKVTNILQLIPRGIREHHDQMLLDFLKTGTSKFFRSIQDNLFITPLGTLVPVNFFIDVNFIDSGLQSTAFFKYIEDPMLYIVVDQNHLIQGISQEFFQQADIDKKYITSCMLDLPISLVIPQFHDLQNDVSSSAYKVVFLREESFVDFSNFIISYGKKKPSMTILEGCWADLANVEIFDSNIQLYHAKHGYWIVKMNYLRRNRKNGSTATYTTLGKTKVVSSAASEALSKEIPYEYSEIQLIEQQSIEQYDPQSFMKGDQILSNRESMSQIQMVNQSNQESKVVKAIAQLQLKQQEFYFTSIEKDQQEESSRKEKQIESKSKISSLSGVKKSSYYKKYELIEKINQSRAITSNIVTLTVLLVLFVVISVIFIVISQVRFSSQFNLYQTNIDLLQIQNYLFQPLELFIITRYIIIDYTNQSSLGFFNSTVLNQLLVYPNSNLNLGFDDVNSNLKSIQSRNSLQDFLAGYYQIYLYTNTNVGHIYNITMREALDILNNYQYTTKAAYVYDGKSVSDSPYIYYSYRNLITFYNAFATLNTQEYNYSQDNTDTDIQIELSLYLPFIIVTVILIFMAFLYYQADLQFSEQILGLLLYSEKISIGQDIERYKYLIESLTSDNQLIFKYQFQISKREKNLTSQAKRISDSSITKRLSFKKRNLPLINTMMVFSLLYIIFILFTTLKYYFIYSYLNSYKPTAVFYQTFANLGTYIPTCYAMRSVLYYRWRYPYFNQTDFNIILLQVQTNLQVIADAGAYLTNLDLNTILISDAFKHNVSILLTGNLCEFQDPSQLSKSGNLCNTTIQGVIPNGLLRVINYIYINLITEMQLNNFTKFTYRTTNEMEGIFIVSTILKQINHQLKLDFQSTTNKVEIQVEVIQKYNQILLMVFGIFLFFLLIIVIFFLYPYLIRKYYYVKRLIYLIPQSTLLLDDAFERQARGIMQQHRIL